jgi:hypothetical protein
MRIRQKATDAIPAASQRGHAPGHADPATTYLWLDAGQSWPFVRGFETISQRALCGWLFVVAACCCWAVTMMMTTGTPSVEATLQMERLAAQLERTTAIPAAAANAVARIVGQPGYDCRHVACSAELADRNRTARARLETLLASKAPANEPDPTANTKMRTAAAEITH